MEVNKVVTPSSLPFNSVVDVVAFIVNLVFSISIFITILLIPLMVVLLIIWIVKHKEWGVTGGKWIRSSLKAYLGLIFIVIGALVLRTVLQFVVGA